MNIYFSHDIVTLIQRCGFFLNFFLQNACLFQYILLLDIGADGQLVTIRNFLDITLQLHLDYFDNSKFIHMLNTNRILLLLFFDTVASLLSVLLLLRHM